MLLATIKCGIMNLISSIRRIDQVFQKQKIDIPELPGVYAFWWVGSKATLLDGNRVIVLKGPNEQLVNVEYKDWWPSSNPFPCLYVGKSTNLRKRFGLHIKRGSEGRLHKACPSNRKAKPRTTSCQLRHGIEHVFPDEENPLELIMKSVGFSYSHDFPSNAVAERFFEEDRLIGNWRPWFNVDSER